MPAILSCSTTSPYWAKKEPEYWPQPRSTRSCRTWLIAAAGKKVLQELVFGINIIPSHPMSRGLPGWSAPSRLGSGRRTATAKNITICRNQLLRRDARSILDHRLYILILNYYEMVCQEQFSRLSQFVNRIRLWWPRSWLEIDPWVREYGWWQWFYQNHL